MQESQVRSWLFRGAALCFLYFVHFVVPMGISSMRNLGCFPQGKPAATESRYPTLINYKVHAGSFRVSIIHQTLTWTTGSVMCVRDHYAWVYTTVLVWLGYRTECLVSWMRMKNMSDLCASGRIRNRFQGSWWNCGCLDNINLTDGYSPLHHNGYARTIKSLHSVVR